MSSPTFFDRARSLTVREIAALTGAEPAGGADLDRRVNGVAALDRALPTDLTFLDKPKYAGQLVASQAGVCLTTERLAAEAPPHVSVLCAARALSRLCRGGADAVSAMRCGPRHCSLRAASPPARSFIRARGSRAASRSIRAR